MRPTVISWIEGRRSYRSVALRSYWTLGNTFNFWMGISSVGTPSVPIQIICYHVNRFQSITIPSDYNRINEDSTNKMIYYGLLVFLQKLGHIIGAQYTSSNHHDPNIVGISNVLFTRTWIMPLLNSQYKEGARDVNNIWITWVIS